MTLARGATIARTAPPSEAAEPDAARAKPRAMGKRTLVRTILRHPEEIVAGFALIVVVFATSWGVTSRYVTAQPAPWAGEVAAIAFAWVTFVGAAAGFKRGLHVSIDLLVTRLPQGAQHWLRWSADLLLLAFFAYVVWLGIGFVQQNWTNPTPVLRLPSSILYAPVPLGFASMTLRHLADLIGRVRGERKATP